MNIGVDVDGVLSDVSDYQIKIGGPYFKKKYGYNLINPNAFDVTEMFGCTEEERNKFGWSKIWTYIICYPATQNASEIIKRLKDDGHKIYIVTGRVKVTEKSLWGSISRFILKNWLKRRDIPYDDIFFCDEHNSVRDKTLGCKKHNIDVMIEDKPENILALSNITKVICYDAGYNRECTGDNIVRARDWDEVYKLITR